MTYLSLIGSVVVFVGTILVWRDEWESFRSVDGEEVVVWCFMLFTSLMTIIVVKVYRPQRIGTTKVF
jgi:magnesium-transporting ATPase (P-type)